MSDGLRVQLYITIAMACIIAKLEVLGGILSSGTH